MLLDLSLPRLNGMRVLGRLRDTPGMDEAPILVITRESDARFEAESSAQGVVKVLEKPVDACALRGYVFDLLPPAVSQPA